MAESWQDAKTAGNQAYAAGDTDGAIAHYTTALRAEGLLSADRAVLLCNRAQCYLKKGDNALAVEDCTACLTLAHDNVKALYRRAAALEALGELKAALRDYRDVNRSNPGVGNAAESIKRLEKALGIAPTPAPAGARRVQLTEEEMRSLSEVQARVKDVGRQRARALEQVRAAQREKRHVELTMSQLGQVPETAGVFKPVGRAFIQSSHAELGAAFQERTAKLAQRVKACESAAAYLDAQFSEAEAAQAEMMRTLQARAA